MLGLKEFVPQGGVFGAWVLNQEPRISVLGWSLGCWLMHSGDKVSRDTKLEP